MNLRCVSKNLPLRWCVTVLVMVFLLPTIGWAGKTIRVQGMNANYKITEKKGEWRLKGPGMNGFTLRNDGGGAWAILDPAGAVRLKAKKSGNGELLLQDSTNVLKYKMVSQEGSYTVYTGAGEVLVRVVLNGEDGFEVFGGDGKKSMTGIAKKRSVAVKDTKSSSTLFKIKGCKSMLEASLFAIPIQFTGNVLIWQVMSGG